MSEDPLELNGGDVNTYRYVGNNPYHFSDPWGLLKYNANPPTTVPVTGTTLELAQCLEACMGTELTISGGAESSGHSPGSQHYSGKACDIKKTPEISGKNIGICSSLCSGINNYSQEESNHYHFQTVPGRGGATGYKGEEVVP